MTPISPPQHSCDATRLSFLRRGRFNPGRVLGVLLAVASGPLLAAAAPPATAPTNDSGQDRCIDFNTYQLIRACAGTGQDADFGRDAGKAAKKDGRAGFSFVKLGPDGAELPADAPAWSCIRDKVTGLTWEMKRHDGGVHDLQRQYTNLGNGQADDVSGLAAASNAEALCGATDWRLPSRRELEGLVDFSVAEGSTMIDTTWFPDTASGFHWASNSASVHGGSPTYRWAVNFYAGQSIWYNGEYPDFVARLVRGGAKLKDSRWDLQGAEVLDTSTRLIWRRCVEGQAWNGGQCTGSASTFLTARDTLAHALAVAEATGLPWRTPNIKELATLVDTRNRGSIDTRVFPGFAGGSVHSATPWAVNRVYDWRVVFGDGRTGLDFWGGQVLLVRDAP